MNTIKMATFMVALSVAAVTAAQGASGTWTNRISGGLWSAGTNWSGGTVADGSGFTADFSKIDLTADNTVRLDGSHTLTALLFGDTATGSAAGWTLTNNGSAANVLTLAGAGPTITVNALGTGKAATISAVVAGSTAWTKAGAGVLTLSGANTFTGGMTNSAGSLQMGANNVLGSGLVVLSGGALSSDSTAARTLTNNLLITAAVTLGDAVNNGAIVNTGVLNLGTAANTARTLTLNSDLVFAGGSTNGGVNKTGPGTMTLKSVVNWNAQSDTFQGTTVVDGAAFTNSQAFRVDASAGNAARLVFTNGTVAVYNNVGANLKCGVTASTGSNYIDLAGIIRLPNVNASSGNIALLPAAAYSEVNLLAGGDIIARSVMNSGTGTGSTRFNFNGGILRALNDNATFCQGLSAAVVQAGGAKIDDQGFSVSIGQPLVDGGGGGGLTKTGTGTLTLTGINTYVGPTIVDAGRLVVSSAQTGGGSFSVSDGATLGVVHNGTTLAASSLTVGAVTGATNSFTLSAGNPAAEVIRAGTLTLNGINQVEIIGTNLTAGQFTLIKYTTRTGTGSFSAIPSSLPSGVIATVSNNVANSSIDLVVGSSGGAATPVLTLAVTPDVVSVSNTAQTVTLSWSATNLSDNASYWISTSHPVTFPSGGQSGLAFNGSTNLQAIVDGTLGSTVFTLSVSNAVPQEVVTATATVTQSLQRPNILLILYDDTGWADFGCYGSFIQTPNIDSLAANGLRFREFYNTARCATTRCSLLTGNYNQQVAAAKGGAAPAPTLNLPDLRENNNITIAELLGTGGALGADGYRTYKAGKWHLGTISSRLPGARGFEHSFGNGTNAAGEGVSDPVFGMWNESQFNIISLNNEIPLRTYAPAKQFHYSDAIGDYCVDFINHCYVTNNGARPFFIYMAFNAPHFPVSAPAAMANRYTDIGDPAPGDADILRYEDGWDVIRPQIYQRQLAMGVIKPGTALSPKGSSEWATAPNLPVGNQAQIVDWTTLNQNQRNDLARREALFAAAVELDDQNIGKVVNRLKELGQFDNTLIFVLSDNGANAEGGAFGISSDPNYTNYWATADLPAMSQPQSGYDALGIPYNKYPGDLHVGASWANVDNTPYRMYKHYDHNGGVRTPMVISWPAGMAASVKGTWTDERGDIKDIIATIQDVTGLTRPTTFNGHSVLPQQGISLKPTFSGNPLPIRDLGFEHEKNRAYYRGKWKLVTKNFAFSDGSSPANELELYDMTADPTELTNRAASEPVVLSKLIDAWNAWCTNVTLPGNASYLLTSFAPPQSDPAPFSTDLFVDNFNRANSVDIDASTNGMSGSRLGAMGVGNTYYQGYGSNAIVVTNFGLRMAVNSIATENGLQHNFIGSDITGAGGFTVQVRVDDIYAFTPDTNCYAGFAVGLTQAEAAGGGDITSPGSFRGNGVNLGVADCFIELDVFGNVKMWSNGVLLVSVPMGQNSGTLLASFATTNFAAGSSVSVSVFLDGQVVDLDPDSSSVTRSFTWKNSNANYIGLSARGNGPFASFVKLDNLAIRTWPLAYAMASDYALSAGLNSPSNAPDADPDLDGNDNIVEWLHGGQPGVKDAARNLLMIGRTAQGEFRFNDFELVNPTDYGVSYTFQCSSNLASWVTFTTEVMSTQADVPGYQLVERRVPPAMAAGNPTLFIQVLDQISGAAGLPTAPAAPAVPLSQVRAAALLPDEQ